MVPLVLVRHTLHVAQKCNDANTQNQKKWKLILILMTLKPRRNSSNGGSQQKTQAMVVFNRKLEHWRSSTGNSSNGGTQRELEQWRYSENTQRDDVRHNQHELMNADSNQGFAASPRQLGPGEKRIKLLAAAAATDRLVIEERINNADTEQRLCLDQCVLSDGCYKARLAPTRAHPGSTCRR